MRKEQTIFLSNVSIREEEASIEAKKDEIGMFLIITSAIELLNLEPAGLL